MILAFLNRLRCRMTGHRRGRQIGVQFDAKQRPLAEYRCGRCPVTWTRPVRKPKEPKP